MPQTTNWTELAAMLTVLAICGSVFTWVVSALIDRKMNTFEKSMRQGFVTKEVLDLLLRQANETHDRHDREHAEMWLRINEKDRP